MYFMFAFVLLEGAVRSILSNCFRGIIDISCKYTFTACPYAIVFVWGFYCERTKCFFFTFLWLKEENTFLLVVYLSICYRQNNFLINDKILNMAQSRYEASLGQAREKVKKQLISNALKSLKQLNKHYLREYESTNAWNKLNQGLILHNADMPINLLVKLKLCEVSSPQRSFFNPFEKEPITLCYNKIKHFSMFEELLTYNMVLLYDTRTKKNVNWNDVEFTVKANVRALTIAGICTKGNYACYERELQERVLDKDRFKNKSFVNLRSMIDESMNDTSPINQTIINQSI